MNEANRSGKSDALISDGLTGSLRRVGTGAIEGDGDGDDENDDEVVF